jgi:5-methylcytosine-specific restriction endonuclease McrBC GTP-binding regulatory subunit McrB
MTGSNHWVDVLSQDELDELHETTASLDPSFAAASRRFWESRTENELSALVHQAWLSNDGDQYQLARSYRARMTSDPGTSARP